VATKKHYTNLRPGPINPIETQLVLAPNEKQYEFLPANNMAMKVSHITLADLPLAYDSASVGLYTTDLASATANDSTVTPREGGIRQQTNGTTTADDTTMMSSNLQWIMVSGKRVTMMAKIRKSDADDIGFILGIAVGTAADLFTTAPTDGVYFVSAKNAATVVGRVIENGNTATDTGTLATMTDGTFIEVGFTFVASTTLADCSGNWWVDGTKTAFTSAQLQDLCDMATTTLPTLSFQYITRVNGTTQRNVVLGHATLACEL